MQHITPVPFVPDRAPPPSRTVAYHTAGYSPQADAGHHSFQTYLKAISAPNELAGSPGHSTEPPPQADLTANGSDDSAVARERHNVTDHAVATTASRDVAGGGHRAAESAYRDEAADRTELNRTEKDRAKQRSVDASDDASAKAAVAHERGTDDRETSHVAGALLGTGDAKHRGDGAKVKNSDYSDGKTKEGMPPPETVAETAAATEQNAKTVQSKARAATGNGGAADGAARGGAPGAGTRAADAGRAKTDSLSHAAKRAETEHGHAAHANNALASDESKAETAAREAAEGANSARVDDPAPGAGHVAADAARVAIEKAALAAEQGVAGNARAVKGLRVNEAAGSEKLRAGARGTHAASVAERRRAVGAESGRVGEKLTTEINVDLDVESVANERARVALDLKPESEGGERADFGEQMVRLDTSTVSSGTESRLNQATTALGRRLNGDLGQSIVRQAQIMLKDAENAEVKLIIRPPELGRVRIQLEMNNGHIAGRILVDNGNVREVIEQNLASLQRAFEAAGLEVGSFEVSTGDARQEGADDQRALHADNRRSGDASEAFNASVESVREYDYGHHRVNLVA